MPLDTGILFLSLFAPFDQLGWLGIAALLGGYSGIYLFLRGFRMLQHKRLILNTPLSKIRSASTGLVEVSGMAKGPQTIRAGSLVSPVTTIGHALGRSRIPAIREGGNRLPTKPWAFPSSWTTVRGRCSSIRRPANTGGK